MHVYFRTTIRLATIALIASFAARTANAITVRVNCGEVRTFASFTSPKELVFLVRNLGNCTAQFTAYDQNDLSGNVLASFSLEPNQAVSVNKPSPPNALARSITIAASGVAEDGRALLDFAALPPDADPNWGRIGDAIYNLNLGGVGIGTSVPTERLDVNGTVQSFGYDGNLRLSSQGSGALYQIVSRGADGALTVDDVRAQTSRFWIAPGTGNVGIGRTNPEYPLHMSSGAHVTTGGVWTDASSRSLKENIKPLELADAVAALSALEPRRFTYKLEPTEEYLGFVAEDVPNAVAMQDRKSLSPMDIVAVLTKVVQAQQSQLESQALEIRILQEQLGTLSPVKASDLTQPAPPTRNEIQTGESSADVR